LKGFVDVFSHKGNGRPFFFLQILGLDMTDVQQITYNNILSKYFKQRLQHSKAIAAAPDGVLVGFEKEGEAPSLEKAEEVLGTWSESEIRSIYTDLRKVRELKGCIPSNSLL